MGLLISVRTYTVIRRTYTQTVTAMSMAKKKKNLGNKKILTMDQSPQLNITLGQNKTKTRFIP